MNKPDMRIKIEEYINELRETVNDIQKNDFQDFIEEGRPLIIVRVRTLEEVINDLQSRLDELI